MSAPKSDSTLSEILASVTKGSMWSAEQERGNQILQKMHSSFFLFKVEGEVLQSKQKRLTRDKLSME